MIIIQESYWPLIWLKQTFGMFSIIPILIIYLIPYYFIWQDSINKKNLKDLLIYYKDNGYLNPFWLVLLY
jgi:hypothetical protein